jgi:Tfp pilus assembly protein PilN
MAEINLLQNRVKDTTHAWEHQSRLTLTVLIMILILLVAATVLLFVINQRIQTQINEVTNSNQDLQKKLNDQQTNLGSAKQFQAQLSNLRVLLKSHVYLSPLLDELSKSTYAKTVYLNLDVTDAGKIHLEGRTDSYGSLGKLMLGLATSTKFKNIKLLSVVPSAGKINAYSFSIDMNVTPDIFVKK